MVSSFERNGIKSFLKRSKRVERIIKKIYRVSFKKLVLKQKSRRLRKKGIFVLQRIDLAFKYINKIYWIDFGTLLGAYRDKNFIDHDTDIDIAMFLKDYDPSVDEALLKFGFRKVREFNIDGGSYGKELTFNLEGINVDIFFYTRINWDMAYYHDFVCLENHDFYDTIKIHGGLVPREIILPLKDITYIDFLGYKFPAPNPIEDHLRMRYGDGFLVKDPNWRWDDSNADNIRILINKIGIVEFF